jgi:hypothetical protein
MFKKKNLNDFIKMPAHILYHVVIIAISAGIALSLPYVVSYFAQEVLVYWALIGNQKVFLIGVEIALAVMLILVFNYIGRVWRDGRIARMSRDAGLVFVASSKAILARRKSKKLKENQGIARDIMLIGSTGYRTFTDPKSELHTVIKNCRQARIMLLNPCSEGANVRAKSILNQDITLEKIREQILSSIKYLKELKAVQKNIRLKLYNGVPFLKLAISGDYMWVKHYHAGFDVQVMPEYVYKHNQKPGSLYVTFYQYFQNQWSDPELPEYDLDTDELVYRSGVGHEERRVIFGNGLAVA